MKTVSSIHSALKDSLKLAFAETEKGRANFMDWYQSAQTNRFQGSQAEYRKILEDLYRAATSEKIIFHDSNSWRQFKETQTGREIGVNDSWAGAAIRYPVKGELHLQGVHIRMDDTVWTNPVTELSPVNLVLHEFAHMAGMHGEHIGERNWRWIPGNTQGDQNHEYQNFTYPVFY